MVVLFLSTYMKQLKTKNIMKSKLEPSEAEYPSSDWDEETALSTLSATVYLQSSDL